jgi:hypothetical protein
MFSEPAALRILSTRIDQSSLIDLIPNPKLMKTQQERRNSFTQLWRRIFRRTATAHDPWLSLNMRLFNYTDGWSRTFSKADYERSWA